MTNIPPGHVDPAAEISAIARGRRSPALPLVGARCYKHRVICFQDELHVQTAPRGLCDVTGQVARVVAASRVRSGVCTVFICHTSASLVIQENADPAVLRDLARWLERLAPESSAYEHDDEGPDDMPAHLRTAVTSVSETVPVVDGRLALGTWQAIYVWEHRSRPHRRRVVVSVLGVPAG